MNRAAIREMLRDTWFRALLVLVPVAAAAQLGGGRTATEIALSLALIAICATVATSATYRRAQTRLATQQDRVRAADRDRALSEFLASREK